MLAIVVLFTIFVGLISLLVAIGECQKRYLTSKKRRDSSDEDLLEQLQSWLAGHQLDVPNPQQIIAILNYSLQQLSSKVGWVICGAGDWPVYGSWLKKLNSALK